MKKLLIIFILASILLIKSAEGITYGSVVSIKCFFVNQDPYPAEPGSYVNLLFKLENWGTKNAENMTFELLPSYPFSLDPGVSAIKELGTVRGLEDEMTYLLKYNVRVDKDAVEGENEIKVKYTYDDGNVYSIKTFNVTVSNPRTDFDVIVQDSTVTSTTLAIVNIGAKTAYSVIVRIPEQNNFRVTGTSASIISNLDAGDYTLVSFQITTIGNITDINATGIPAEWAARRERTTQIGNVTDIPVGGRGNLVVEISYTDTLGIRRTIQKEVRLDTAGTIEGETIARTIQGSQWQASGGSGLTYIGIGALGIAVIVGIAVFFKFRKKMKRKKE